MSALAYVATNEPVSHNGRTYARADESSLLVCERLIRALDAAISRSRLEHDWTIWEAIQSLVAKGYIRDRQRRNCQIVWVATEWREPEGSA